MDVSDAVALIKEAVGDPAGRVRLHDLLSAETFAVLAATGDDAMPLSGTVDQAGYRERVDSVEAAAAPLVAMSSVAAFFAVEDAHDRTIVDVVDRLSRRERGDGHSALSSLQLLPALLVVYGVGIGAVAGRRVRPFGRVLAEVVVRCDHLTEAIAPVLLEGTFVESFAKAFDLANHHTPESDHIHELLQSSAAAFGLDGTRYDDVFDHVEYVLGLAYLHARSRSWAPVGRFGWRNRHHESAPHAAIIDRAGVALVAAGMFDSDGDKLAEVRAAYDQIVAEQSRRWW